MTPDLYPIVSVLTTYNETIKEKGLVKSTGFEPVSYADREEVSIALSGLSYNFIEGAVLPVT